MKLLFYILIFPFLLVPSYSFGQQKLIQLPKKVMEYCVQFDNNNSESMIIRLKNARNFSSV